MHTTPPTTTTRKPRSGAFDCRHSAFGCVVTFKTRKSEQSHVSKGHCRALTVSHGESNILLRTCRVELEQKNELLQKGEQHQAAQGQAMRRLTFENRGLRMKAGNYRGSINGLRQEVEELTEHKAFLQRTCRMYADQLQQAARRGAAAERAAAFEQTSKRILERLLARTPEPVNCVDDPSP